MTLRLSTESAKDRSIIYWTSYNMPDTTCPITNVVLSYSEVNIVHFIIVFTINYLKIDFK